METNEHYHEDQADILLSMLPRGGAPHYSQWQLLRKLRKDERKACRLRADLPAVSEATLLLQRHALSSVVARAELTKRQREVFRAKVAGCGWLDIGRRFGHSKQAAQRIFAQAVLKIRRAWKEYPLAGLPEVYRQEVRRYTPRRH